MEAHSASPGDAWRLGEGPFIFHGVPPMCVGDLDLINQSDEKVRVRTISAVGFKDEAMLKSGLAELKVGVRILPRASTRARAFFLLDPHTPPGTYTADLACGSQREPVTVHVWEKASLSISPGVIRLRGGAGDVIKTTIVITNQGNITETLRELALVYLEERNWIGRSLVYAMRETKEAEGHQAYLDRAVAELKDTIARPARLTVHTGISELRPGQTREVELEITLPDELKKGRHYFASAKFMSRELIFDVECNGASNSTKRRPR